MLRFTRENFIYKIFIFISLLFCPIVAIAPLGSWILLVLAAISYFLFYKDISKKTFFKDIPLVILIAFFWIIISTIYIGKNLSLLEKVLHLIFLILSGVVVSNTKIENLHFKKITLIFSMSFIVSILLIIIDTKFNLGLKLWLSKNFDFSNFENLFELKYWIGLNDFREKYFGVIKSYNQTTYSRGVVGLTALTLPLFTLCYFFNLKLLGYIIIIFSISLSLYTFNYTVLFCCIAAIFFGLIFYFKKELFKKYFLYFLGLYFLSSPFILGKLDYKNFSGYESILLQKRDSIFFKYCKHRFWHEEFLYIEKGRILIDCTKNDNQKNENLRSNDLFDNISRIEKIKLFIQSKTYNFASEKIHRLIIWSFVKEKVLERPILGHGFFASRFIVNETKQTVNLTNYELIPLHPHNNILQIWLELGIVGLIIFFILIRTFLKRIYEFSNINNKVSAIAMISFLQIFFIGQISFGIWQSWWISIILINLILYKFAFKCFKLHVSQSNSSD